MFVTMRQFQYTKPGPSAGFLKGGCGGGCGRGLWISVPRGGYRISGYRGCIEKVSPSKARHENFGVFCVKNHIFSNFKGGAGCALPLESDTGSGSDNTSM